MSLRIAVAAPFQQNGRERMDESEFVVALSLDRDWFSPDQAKRLVDVASGQGLLSRSDGELVAEFDLHAVEIPEEFSPGEDMLREQSTFERIIDELVADGSEKQAVVAGVNELQAELGVTVEAAAVVYARRQGVEVHEAAASAVESLRE